MLRDKPLRLWWDWLSEIALPRRRIVHLSTLQAMEARKAKDRIQFYLAGGSRPVFVSRWVLSAVLIVIWFVLWWRS